MSAGLQPHHKMNVADKEDADDASANCTICVYLLVYFIRPTEVVKVWQQPESENTQGNAI